MTPTEHEAQRRSVAASLTVATRSLAETGYRSKDQRALVQASLAPSRPGAVLRMTMANRWPGERRPYSAAPAARS